MNDKKVTAMEAIEDMRLAKLFIITEGGKITSSVANRYFKQMEKYAQFCLEDKQNEWNEKIRSLVGMAGEVSNEDISYELYSFETCGEVMEFLDKNNDFDKLKELIKLQGHTAGTMSLLGQVMLYFSSYGLEFVDNIVGDRLGLLTNLKDEYNKVKRKQKTVMKKLQK